MSKQLENEIKKQMLLVDKRAADALADRIKSVCHTMFESRGEMPYEKLEQMVMTAPDEFWLEHSLLALGVLSCLKFELIQTHDTPSCSH